MLNVYKLINGEDLIGNVVEEAETGVFVQNPVSYITMPNHGFQMKDWLILVNEDVIFIDNKNIMVDLGAPNDFGAYCYESFISHRHAQKKFLSDSLNDQVEEEIPTSEMSDDVKEIFEKLQLTSKRQLN